MAPRSDSTSLPSSVARTVGLVVLLGTGILLASGCKEKESRTTGLPATNDDGTPLAVKCNTRSIAKKLEPSNEGSTPKSAFLIFLAIWVAAIFFGIGVLAPIGARVEERNRKAGHIARDDFSSSD